MEEFQIFESFIKAVQKNDLNLVRNYYRSTFLQKLDENDLTGFHHACNLGYPEIAKYFIDKGVNIEFPCPYNGWRALHWAVGNGYEEVGQLLIEYGADRECRTSKGLHPLHCAALANRVAAVKMLLINGVNLNSKNNKNETARQMAVDNECVECVELFDKWIGYPQIFNLIRRNSLDAFKMSFIKERVLVKEDQTELTVLDVAVEYRAYEYLETILLEDPDEKDVMNGLARTIDRLQIPIEEMRSQFRLYRSILFEKKDEFRENSTVQITNELCKLSGESFLEICVRHNREIFVRELLERILNVDESWTRALRISTNLGLTQTENKIISRISFIENRIKAGYNRLHIAVQDNNVDVIKFILDKKLQDPNICNGVGLTPLAMSVVKNDEKLCIILINGGADVFLPFQIPITNQMENIFSSAIIPIGVEENPLTLSLKLHRTIFDSMVNKINGVKCNIVDNDGNSLLHLSTRLLVPSISKLLIERGCSVNCLNMSGNTPLHSAFLESTENSWEMEGFGDTIELLLKNRANINMRNFEGVSVFKCALETNSRRTLTMILNECVELEVEMEDVLILYERQWPEALKAVLDLQSEAFRRMLLMTNIREPNLELIEFIIELSGESIMRAMIEECLCLAAELEREEIFDRFLQEKISEPKLFENGETVLTNMILCAKEQFSVKLCKCDCGEKILEMKNRNNETPLYVAAKRCYLKLFKHLIIECDNFEDAHNGILAIEILIDKINERKENRDIAKLEVIMKIMIKRGLDIYQMRKNGHSIISKIKDASTKTKLENFFSKGKKTIILEEIDEDKNLCEICLSNKINCQFGCGHPFCRNCAERVNNCPKCRQNKTKIIPLYIN